MGCPGKIINVRPIPQIALMEINSYCAFGIDQVIAALSSCNLEKLLIASLKHNSLICFDRSQTISRNQQTFFIVNTRSHIGNTSVELLPQYCSFRLLFISFHATWRFWTTLRTFWSNPKDDLMGELLRE